MEKNSKNSLELRVDELEKKVGELEVKSGTVINPMDAFKTLLSALVEFFQNRFFKSKESKRS
jgi:hypothetical protein